MNSTKKSPRTPWLYALYAAAGCACLFLLVGLCLPSTWHIERSVVVYTNTDTVRADSQSSSEKIFSDINDLRMWPTWTAFLSAADPSLKAKCLENQIGVGAACAWSGKKTGQGDISLTESVPFSHISYTTHLRNHHFESDGRIVLKQTPEGVQITWTDNGRIGWNPFSRYFGLMISDLIAPDLQKSLENLKKRHEIPEKIKKTNP